jgi:hypothetical protein
MSDGAAGPSFRIWTSVGVNLWTIEKSNVFGEMLAPVQLPSGSSSESGKARAASWIVSTATSIRGSWSSRTTSMSLTTSRRSDAFVIVTVSQVCLSCTSPALPKISLFGDVSFASKWIRPPSS